MFSTKADTLSELSGKLRKSHIEKIYIVTAQDYFINKKYHLQQIKHIYHGGKIVVRSSSSNEDAWETSNAGHYDSILDVPSFDEEAVDNAICTVFDSYKKDIEDISEEQVLIQTMTTDIVCSGVVFSRDIKENRPYYTVSYDESSTDAVTSGRSCKTMYVARTSPLDQLPAEWAALIDAVRELEDIYPYPLDIEFAINHINEVTIFQVRPLAACICRTDKKYKEMDIQKKKYEDSNRDFVASGQLITGIIREYENICNLLMEKNTILSDMAFWNPAEIIGENPHPLDYSLYRDIITKSAWNQGLTSIGYKYVDGELMYHIGNKPYISLHQSFLCLIPDSMDNHLAHKLVNYYNKKLLADITAHDKIEFEIIFSNYDFTTSDRLKELENYGFTIDEIEDIRDELFKLTNDAIVNFKQSRIRDHRALNGLKVHRENICNNWLMSINDVNTLIGYVLELLESIKEYGTPKFARQARLAFISKSICRSLVSNGYLTQREIDDFMMSIYTVASEYDRDFKLYESGNITKEEFNSTYGHLRSGTYDITCETYGEKNYQITGVNHNSTCEASGRTGEDNNLETASNRLHEYEISKTEHASLEKYGGLNQEIMAKALQDIGFTVELPEFMEFLKESMEEREYFKFEFTRSLSLVIDIIIDIGNKLNISKYDMAYLTIDDIIAMCNKPVEYITRTWKNVIEENKHQYNINSTLILPDVIQNKNQFYIHQLMEARPNYITSEIVTGQVAVLDNKENVSQISEDIDVSGKIVVIPKADPGYDWIFTKGIKGFITKYGGVASHMAIRCAEFNIPAAIGCGDVIYNYVTQLDRLTLDCKNGRIMEKKEV
jgi:phosphohistidine swiveling domain-containing protein